MLENSFCMYMYIDCLRGERKIPDGQSNLKIEIKMTTPCVKKKKRQTEKYQFTRLKPED